MENDSRNTNNLWVFRDGKTPVDGRLLRGEVEAAASSLFNDAVTPEAVISALLRAGEFEAALGDVDPLHLASAESLTNALAGCLWDDTLRNQALRIPEALQELGAIAVPSTLRISPPEGFAYYALHPLDVAALADNLPGLAPAAIVGIRSIGTTLSAIVLASLRRRRIDAERITVRPTGHPYERVMQFTSEQLSWIAARRTRGCDFLVVDEGPGRSGSSFLCVAEALEQAGVPRQTITLVGSRAINPDELCAPQAASRWTRFRFVWPAPKRYDRFKLDRYIGGGQWRKVLLKADSSGWPACWEQMERFKFLSADGRAIYKFEGFGRFGDEVLQRAHRLAEAGFGPAAECTGDGMVRYATVDGKPAPAISRTILEQLADYCAFRAREFQIRNAPPNELGDMLQFNIQQEFGLAPHLDRSVFTAFSPVLADGRMQPHEWIMCGNGTLLKVDGCTHGDDHFFPGPTDIAWDLAGLIVEWNLDGNAAEFLLARYSRQSGDDVTRRIPPYLLAYTVFRLGYCKMALSSVVGTPEYSRLQTAADRYREAARRALAKLRRAQQSRLLPGRKVASAPTLLTMNTEIESAP